LLPEAVYRDLYGRLLEEYGKAFKTILLSRQHLEQMTRDSLDEGRSAETLALVEEQTGLSLRGRRVLEVGAGVCMTLATARLRFGADAHGIEPSAQEYSYSVSLARDLLRALGQPGHVLKVGAGEAIPHPDASFDVVFSSNVLEHTADPARVLAESVRVLKPGGFLCHVVPNYGSWWEGHYGIPWIPHLNKFLGRLYLRLWRKDPSFLDTLQLINRGWVRRMLAPLRGEIEVLGWGQELFVRRLRTLEFSEYAALGRLKRLLRVVRRLGLLRLGIFLGKLFHWETPLVITARKRQAGAAGRRAA
jgi:SAM-dependent methyltransferase